MGIYWAYQSPLKGPQQRRPPTARVTHLYTLNGSYIPYIQHIPSYVYPLTCFPHISIITVYLYTLNNRRGPPFFHSPIFVTFFDPVEIQGAVASFNGVTLKGCLGWPSLRWKRQPKTQHNQKLVVKTNSLHNLHLKKWWFGRWSFSLLGRPSGRFLEGTSSSLHSG